MERERERAEEREKRIKTEKKGKKKQEVWSVASTGNKEIKKCLLAWL